MKIATVQGSPRRKGCTAKVLGWVQEALQGMGHEIDHIHVTDYDIGGCVECYSCQKAVTDSPDCALDDDGNAVLQRLVDADAIVLASPIFCWSVTAQLKALLDRCFCTLKALHSGDPQPLFRDKAFGMLVTGGGPVEGNMDMMLAPFHNLVEICKGSKECTLMVPMCTTPEAMDDPIREKAQAFAKEIVG